MKYLCKVLLKRTIQEVFDTVRDYPQMMNWETGLTRIEQKTDEINSLGSITNLVFTYGVNEMVMKETIVEVNAPFSIAVIFDNKNATPLEEFIKQTTQGMNVFKEYLEKMKNR